MKLINTIFGISGIMRVPKKGKIIRKEAHND